MFALHPPVTFESPIKTFGHLFDTTIGAFSYVQSGCMIASTDIGRFCSIAANVVTGPGEHPVDWLSTHPFINDPTDAAANLLPVYPSYARWLAGKPSSRPVARQNDRVVLGNDVWVGDGALIRRGVEIGHGAIVAARAVVTRYVEPYSIVGGSPARHIRYRFDQRTRERLLRVGWWDYDIGAIADRIDFSNVAQALDTIEEALRQGEVGRLNPVRYTVTEAGATPCA